MWKGSVPVRVRDNKALNSVYESVKKAKGEGASKRCQKHKNGGNHYYIPTSTYFTFNGGGKERIDREYRDDE